MLLHRWMKSLIGTSARSPRRASAPAPRPKFWAEILEDRTVLAANFATGAALGEVGIVRVYDGSTQAQTAAFLAYDPAFTGGVNVARGDVTGDGVADIITGTASATSHVKVFDGVNFQELRSFLAFTGFNGGVNVAAGDIDADGKDDIVVSTATGDSHVKAFSGADNSELASFFAYPGFAGGVRVAVGDVDLSITHILLADLVAQE